MFSTILKVKHVADCRTAIVEVVRSSDGRRRIRRQGSGSPSTDPVQGRLVDGEFPGRYVDFETPVKRDVVSQSGLKDRTNDLVNFVVAMLGPHRRAV